MKILFFFLGAVLTFNCYAQWQATSGPAGGAIRCVATMNSNIFASPNIGGLFRSIDNGDAWVATNFPIVGVSTIIVNDTTVFAGTGHGVYMSSDLGSTWTQINNGLTDTLITSLAVCGTTIFAGTFSSGMFLSANNGASWSPANNGITNLYIKSLAINGSTIYAGTAWWNGGVFYSTNNGYSWTLSENGLPDADVWSVAIYGSNIFAGLYNRGVFMSSNLGSNWIVSNNGLLDTTFTCLHVKGTYVFAGFAYSGVYLTTDIGNNWVSFNTGYIGTVISLASNDTYIFAATGASGVWRRKLSDLTGVSEISDNNKFSIYPNPTNDILNIDLSFGTDTKTKIVLCDLLGNTIKTIDQGVFSSKHIATGTNNLSNGVYFIRIELPDKAILKKLTVIK